MSAPSLRERNNKARREHYDREKEKQEWRAFEDAVVREHHRTYGHEIWHTSTIPECELYEAGIFNDYNKLRMDRIRRRRERNGEVFKYLDYGVDFLSKEPGDVPIYHIGQAKHYRSRKVSANDLGTFLLMRLCVPTQSYLYTSGPLEVNLHETLQAHSQQIAHHRIDFAAVCDAKSKATVNASASESTMARRTYQIAAAKACGGPGRKILEMACGTGKTVVAGDILAASGAQRIVCVAPLLVSVHNLYDRLQPFLKSHRHVLVDSEGTTDDVDVEAFFETGDKIVVYTTFKSMECVIAPFLKPTDYVLVDEVHNAMQREGLCDLFRQCSNALFLSATIPEALGEMLDAETAYTYSMLDAIRDKFVCDYEVILPSLTDGRVDCTVPEEWRAAIPLDEVHNSMAAKALFLATGMLQYGNRRCIVYLQTREDCDVFMTWTRKVMEEHHGLSVWCGKIDASVGARDRKELLTTFECDDAYDKYIMTSVRILDEAVDIPRCDCEYITSVNDHLSEIRTVQRLSRGGRLDPLQPFKKNRLFLWTDEWNNACQMLSLLREMDPTFHTKVRSLCGDYDRTAGANARVVGESRELQSFVRMRCLSLEERFMHRLHEWKAVVERLGRTPSNGSKDPNENRCAVWQSHMRHKYKKGALLVDKIKVLEETPAWTWGYDSFSKNVDLWKNVFARLGRTPSQNAKDAHEKRSGMWQVRMRSNYKSGTLSVEKIRLLEETPGWKWGNDSFTNNMEWWKRQVARLKRTPSQKSKDAHEKRSGQWQNSMRKFYKRGTLSVEKIRALEDTPMWKWEKTDSFPYNLEQWKKQVARIGRTPSHKSQDAGEKCSAVWQSGVRHNYKKGTLLAERIQVLENTAMWKWEEDHFPNNLEQWKKQVARLGRTPWQSAKDADEKRSEH